MQSHLIHFRFLEIDLFQFSIFLILILKSNFNLFKFRFYFLPMIMSDYENSYFLKYEKGGGGLTELDARTQCDIC